MTENQQDQSSNGIVIEILGVLIEATIVLALGIAVIHIVVAFYNSIFLAMVSTTR